MTRTRQLIVPLGALAALLLTCSACSTQEGGHPEFAGSLTTPTDLPTGGGIDGPTSTGPSASASSSPTDTASSGPSASLSPQQIAAKLCSIVPSDELTDIFHGPVHTQPGIAYQCTLTGEEAKVLLYEFPDQSLTTAVQDATHPVQTTISGHPAVVDGSTISVSEGEHADDPGLLRALTLHGEDSIARSLLQHVVPKFSH